MESDRRIELRDNVIEQLRAAANRPYGDIVNVNVATDRNRFVSFMVSPSSRRGDPCGPQVKLVLGTPGGDHPGLLEVGWSPPGKDDDFWHGELSIPAAADIAVATICDVYCADIADIVVETPSAVEERFRADMPPETVALLRKVQDKLDRAVQQGMDDYMFGEGAHVRARGRLRQSAALVLRRRPWLVDERLPAPAGEPPGGSAVGTWARSVLAEDYERAHGLLKDAQACPPDDWTDLHLRIADVFHELLGGGLDGVLEKAVIATNAGGFGLLLPGELLDVVRDDDTLKGHVKSVVHPAVVACLRKKLAHLVREAFPRTVVVELATFPDALLSDDDGVVDDEEVEYMPIERLAAADGSTTATAADVYSAFNSHVLDGILGCVSTIAELLGIDLTSDGPKLIEIGDDA